MANHTTSSDIDAFLKSADKEGARAAIGSAEAMLADEVAISGFSEEILPSYFGKVVKHSGNGIIEMPDPALYPGRAFFFETSGTATVSEYPIVDASGADAGIIAAIDGRQLIICSGGRWNAPNIGIYPTKRGTAAPATTPEVSGQMYVDTINNKVYVSTGISSVADWTALN
ncbi:MAG: hypothetical protein AAGI48_17715 [Verrucomicrobiota bacterium]